MLLLFNLESIRDLASIVVAGDPATVDQPLSEKLEDVADRLGYDVFRSWTAGFLATRTQSPDVYGNFVAALNYLFPQDVFHGALPQNSYFKPFQKLSKSLWEYYTSTAPKLELLPLPVEGDSSCTQLFHRLLLWLLRRFRGSRNYLGRLREQRVPVSIGLL